jgi:hypothetical protein
LLGGAEAATAPAQEPTSPLANRNDGEHSGRNFDGRGTEEIFDACRARLERLLLTQPANG